MVEIGMMLGLNKRDLDEIDDMDQRDFHLVHLYWQKFGALKPFLYKTDDTNDETIDG